MPPQGPRPHKIRVTVSDAELAKLDEMRPEGTTRPAFLRSLIRGTLDISEVATRTESLAILTAGARDGKVSAAIALERALREDAAPAKEPEDELDRILKK